MHASRSPVSTSEFAHSNPLSAEQDARFAWLDACDAYEMAQDTGLSEAEMKALRQAALDAYEACH